MTAAVSLRLPGDLPDNPPGHDSVDDGAEDLPAGHPAG